MTGNIEAVPRSDDGLCPNCGASLKMTDVRCELCEADFASAEGWKPKARTSDSNQARTVDFNKALLHKYEQMGTDEIMRCQSQHDLIDREEYPYLVKEIRRRKLALKPELAGIESIKVPNRFPWWIWILALFAYRGIRSLIDYLGA